MRLHSYALPGPAVPGNEVFFPRLDTMAKLLGVSLLATMTGSTATFPIVRIRDGANLLLAEFAAEPLLLAIGATVNWYPNQPASMSGATPIGVASGELSRGFVPPDFWLPPNWQLSVQLVDAPATVVFERVQMMFLSPE